MRRLTPILVVLVVAAAAAVWAAPGDPGRTPMAGRAPFAGPGGPMGHGGPGGPEGPAFGKYLYPPELVLNNQIAIGLTDDQIATIKRLLAETHARVVDIQVDLQRAGENLHGILEPARVDESAALAAAERAMTLESQMKKAHLTLLIRIKNLLTEDQQAQLEDLRPERPPRGRP